MQEEIEVYNSEESNETYYYDLYEKSINKTAHEFTTTTIVILCVIGVSFLLGVIGNILVPIVILKSHDLRTSTNVFLINLAIADCLVILLCVPPAVVEMYAGFGHRWIFGSVMCYLVPYAELTAAHVSSVTLVTVGLERYIAVCRPLQAGSTCTRKRAAYLCLGAWALSSATASPVLWTTSYEVVGMPFEVCFTMSDQSWQSVFFFSSTVLFFILPLAVLIIVYTLISRYLILDRQTVRRLGGSRRSIVNTSRTRVRIVVMLGIIVTCFFICMLPFRVIILIVIFTPNPYETFGPNLFFFLINISRTLGYINCIVNPILYNMMSSKFRSGFIRFFQPGAHLARHGTIITSSTTASSRQRNGRGPGSRSHSEVITT